MIFLLGGWAALLFGGFLLGPPHPTRRMPTWTRIASSFVLLVAGWVWWFLTEESPEEPLALWIALGMTLGVLGDLFMARLIIQSDSHILGGIAAFGMGHIAYIIGILRYNASPQWAMLVFWLILGGVLWYAVVWRGTTKPTGIHIASLPYALLLAATAGFATSLALQDSLFITMAIGAVLFLLSDLILAAQLFNGLTFHLIGDVIWLTYGPGQMLIVFTLAFPSIF